MINNINSGGFFSGPTDQTAVDDLKAWGINAVRVPLNEQCWLGIFLLLQCAFHILTELAYGTISASHSGQNYINAIYTWVTLLTSNDIAVIVDLHW